MGRIGDKLPFKLGYEVFHVTASLAGDGSLTAAAAARKKSTASLSSTGSLAATVSKVQVVTSAAAFLSTGQLDAEVEKVEPPPYDGGWTTDIDVEPPPRHQGPSWSSSPSVAVLPKPGGWFALLEKVSPHIGAGNLTSLLAPKYATVTNLAGAGALTTDLVIRKPRTVPLGGSGQLVGGLFERKALTAFFTGSGKYDALSINDGLVAIIQVGYAAKFSGGGLLVVDTEGGAHYQDGLTAGVLPRYLVPTYFSSEGQLLAFSGEVSVAMAYLVGSGALTVTNQKQLYPLMVALAGNGTLSAPAFAAYKTLVNLLGTGTLNAPAFARYLTSVGFAGAGAFTALLLASYDRASPSGGVGTVTAAVLQKYNLFPNFSGAGQSDFDIEGVINVEEIGAYFEGDGALDAEVYGLINEMFAILSGSGALSAQARALFRQIALLSGSGTLTAPMLASYQRLAALLGNGSLTVETFIQYARAMGLSGAGTFAALAWKLGQAESDTGGVGTVSATVMARYPLAVPFSGGGILSAPETFDATYPDGLSARVGRSYGAFLGGSGALSALTRMYQIQSVAALTGGGTLAATATKVQKDYITASPTGGGALSAAVLVRGFSAASLSGTGTLSATVSPVYRLPVQLTNIVPDGGFEDDATWNVGWQGTQTTEQARSGSKSRRLVGTGNWVQLILTIKDSGNPNGGYLQPTVQGRRIYAETWLRRHPANTDTGSVFIRILCTDNTGAEVPGGNVYNLFPPTAVPSNGWQKFSVDTIAPANATHFYADILFDPNVPTTDVYYVDDVAVTGGDRARAPFVDNFNRADDFAQIGNGWVPRNGVMGIYTNGVVPVTANVWNEASAPMVMNADDMEVSFTLGALIGNGTNDYTTIMFGCNAVGEGTFIFFNGGAGVTIYSQLLWDTAGLAVQASAQILSQAVGDKFTARRMGNVYTILKNGAPVLDWPDTGNIIPRDANHRLVGLAGYTDGTNARRVDDFTAGDVGMLYGGGSLSATAVKVPQAFVTANFSGGGTVSATQAFAPNGPTTTLRLQGATSYTIPWWANRVDVVCLGAGAGGQAGAYSLGAAGKGGLAGAYNWSTVVRGTTVAWTTTTISANGGAGGTAGAPNGGNGGPGGASSVSAAGWAGFSAAGGASSTASGQNGNAPGNQVFNGQTYTGAAGGTGNGGGGGAPGGGAAGGNGGGFLANGSAGGVGGRGQVWFYAYQ